MQEVVEEEHTKKTEAILWARCSKAGKSVDVLQKLVSYRLHLPSRFRKIGDGYGLCQDKKQQKPLATINQHEGWDFCTTWCCLSMLAWVDTSTPSLSASVIVSYCLQRQFCWWAVEQAVSNSRVNHLSVYLLLHKVVFELLKRSFQASRVPLLLKLSSRAKPSSQHNSWPDGIHFFLRKLLSGKKPSFHF